MVANAAGERRTAEDDRRLGERQSFPSNQPQHFPIALGGQIYYAESLEKLAANIEEVHPTIMVVVPRLFELLRTRIIKSIEGQGGFAKYLLYRALKIGGPSL